GRRECGWTAVMIDDDRVDPELIRARDLVGGGDAAVEGHEDLRAFAGELLHCVLVEPVAFDQAFRDVDVRLDAVKAKKRSEKRGRGDAVDVVVAVERDALALLDRLDQAERSAIDMLHGRWIREVRELGPQVALGVDLAGEAAAD